MTLKTMPRFIVRIYYPKEENISWTADY